MVDYYTSVCFAIDVTHEEAALIDEVQRICNALCDGIADPKSEAARYAQSSESFRKLFPAADPTKPFAALADVFDDCTDPRISADFRISAEANGAGKVLEVNGSSVDPWEIANLLRKLAPSALPFNFGYAHTASRDRHDAYGGGYIEVRSDKIVELAGFHEDSDERHLVIAALRAEHGLAFWNAASGWSELGAASVYTERDRTTLSLPLSDPPALWMELPPRHAYFQVLS